MSSCLKSYGFGPNFRKWISTIYNNTESCVTNNGYQLKFFKLSRGIRQGCPLSALLFLLPAEVIATVIRNSDQVKGISLNNTNFKLCQLADDMTLFLNSITSVKYALKLFEEFYRYAGLKLNKRKTEAFIVYNNGSIMLEDDLGISWINKPFKALGIWFASNQEEMIKLNIADKADKIKSILNLWQGRVLTLTGKITILKSLVLPHILHLAYVLPLCETLLMDLDKLFFDFVWNKRKHLVSKQTLLQSYDMGGLKMLSIADMVKTAKIMWVKRFSNEINAKWKVLSENLMGLNREQLFHKSMFKNIKLKPQTAFYSDLLSIWFHFVTVEPMTFKELLEENLFHNDLITIGDRAIDSEYSDWQHMGIAKVCDILKHDRSFKSKIELETIYNITIPNMKYNRIISSLKSKIGNLPLGNNYSLETTIPQLCFKNIAKVNSKQVYMHKIKLMNKTPASQNKWVEYYPFLEAINWKKIYLLPFQIARSTLLITFQFKIIHRIFNCNYNLFNWKILDSPECSVCTKIDNIEHFFFYCDQSMFFWTQVEKWLSENIDYTYSFTVLEVLLGCINCNKYFFYIINSVILIGKYSIKTCKQNQNDMFFSVFLQTLRYFLNIEKNIYSSKDSLSVFNDMYGVLYLKLQV